MSFEQVCGMSRLGSSRGNSLGGWTYGINTTSEPAARSMPCTTRTSHTAHMLNAPFCTPFYENYQPRFSGLLLGTRMAGFGRNWTA